MYDAREGVVLRSEDHVRLCVLGEGERANLRRRLLLSNPSIQGAMSASDREICGFRVTILDNVPIRYLF